MPPRALFYAASTCLPDQTAMIVYSREPASTGAYDTSSFTDLFVHHKPLFLYVISCGFWEQRRGSLAPSVPGSIPGHTLMVCFADTSMFCTLCWLFFGEK